MHYFHCYLFIAPLYICYVIISHFATAGIICPYSFLMFALVWAFPKNEFVNFFTASKAAIDLQQINVVEAYQPWESWRSLEQALELLLNFKNSQPSVPEWWAAQLPTCFSLGQSPEGDRAFECRNQRQDMRWREYLSEWLSCSLCAVDSSRSHRTSSIKTWISAELKGSQLLEHQQSHRGYHHYVQNTIRCLSKFC